MLAWGLEGWVVQVEAAVQVVVLAVVWVAFRCGVQMDDRVHRILASATIVFHSSGTVYPQS